MYTINYYCKRPYYEIKQKIVNNLDMIVQFKTLKVIKQRSESFTKKIH